MDNSTQNERVVDQSCLYNFSKGIIRLQYPGIVKNVQKAIETIGGIGALESAVSYPKSKLQLHFHPENNYNKGIYGDKDNNPGILIKIKRYVEAGKETLNYEVIGVTSVNFEFNRICDFQYLPLHTKEKETVSTKLEFIYDKILPEKLPNLKWLQREESENMPEFFVPTCFAKYESVQNKLFLAGGEKYDISVRPELISSTVPTSGNKKRVNPTQHTIFVSFHKENVEIPIEPEKSALQNVEGRQLHNEMKLMQKLFEERPIWLKAAVLFKTKLKYEHAKFILPAIAYFCITGPWRMCWIKFGYDPQKEFSSRIYQTLDYRIRTAEGTKLKVKIKRNYSSKRHIQQNLPSFSEDSSTRPNDVTESAFILKPNVLPPARQMFYQYCDIQLPRIQDMLKKLPKLPIETKYHNKNGWLPTTFTEQCREIVNDCILKTVQQLLIADYEKSQPSEDTIEKTSVAYCSKMLETIKKGKFGSRDSPKETSKNLEVVDTIDLLDEGETTEDFIDRIPERMQEDSDEENFSTDSDLEIDAEAAEEVNKIIAGIRHDENFSF